MMKDKLEALELDKVKEQIVRHCAFSLGKQNIRETYPSFDELWVKRELTRSKEAYDLVIRYGPIPMGGVRDISLSVQDALKAITLSPQELMEIAECIRASDHLLSYRRASELTTPLIDELIDSLSDHHIVAEDIERCINVNFEVLDNASPELKQVRRAIRSCEQEISSEVQRFISRHASSLMDTITATRNDRTCVLVKIAEKNSIDGMLHGESARPKRLISRHRTSSHPE